MRIALIHALKQSIQPIEKSFAKIWPEAKTFNILDDSLSSDLVRDGKLTALTTERFLILARYAAQIGSDGILFTCSAFGECISACAQELHPLPVLKPYEAMIEKAAVRGRRIGLLATFAPTLISMPSEFPKDVTLQTKLAAGALDALEKGLPDEHDKLAVSAAHDLVGCDVIALAQFSLARTAPLIEASLRKPVLTPQDCAAAKMKMLLTPQGCDQ